MTRDEVQSRSGCHVSRETFEKLETFVDLVLREANRQNLISRSTVEDIWARHIVDSIQLLRFSQPGIWMDLGTGAGFPGMVIATFELTQVVMVEERRLRYEFLSVASDILGLRNVTIVGSKLERAKAFPAGIISARAFASFDQILSLSQRFSTPTTRYVLPKGKNAADELASIKGTWHGDFRLEPSVTDLDSSIIIAENVSLKG